MDSCIFCRIVGGEIDADVVREEEDHLAFRDANPQAPTHILVIPRRHVETVNDLGSDDAALIGRMVLTARELAAEEGVSGSGYRLVVNTNAHGGQSVDHVHLHLLGGRAMSWPPG